MIGENSLKKYRFYIAIAIFVLALIFNIFVFYPTLYVQDEAGTFFPIKNLISSNSFNLNSDLNYKFNTTIFHPGYSSYTKDGKILSSSPSSLVFIFSSLYPFFGNEILYFNSILAALIVLLVFAFSIKIFNKTNYALISSTLVIFMPIFIRYSDSFFNILLAIFITLILFYLTFFKIQTNKKYFLLISILLNCLLFIRLSEGILLFPIFILIIYFSFGGTTIKYKIKKIGVFIFIFFLTLLIFQLPVILKDSNGLFSSPFIGRQPYLSNDNSLNLVSYSDGYKSNLLDKVIAYPLGTKTGFKDFSLNTYFQSLKTNLLALTFFGAYPFFLLIIPALLLFKRNKKLGKIGPFILILFLILLLFYGTRTQYYGFNLENISSSIYRYFLIIFLFSAIIFPIILDFLKINNKRYKILLYSLVILLYITISFNYSLGQNYRGFKEINNFKRNQIEYLDYISTLDKNNSIFITNPNTGRYTYLLNSDLSYKRSFDYYIGDSYYNTSIESYMFNDSIRVFNLAIDGGYNVYFLYSPYDQTSQIRYFALINQSFSVTKLNDALNSDNVIIYRLERSN